MEKGGQVDKPKTYKSALQAVREYEERNKEFLEKLDKGPREQNEKRLESLRVLARQFYRVEEQLRAFNHRLTAPVAALANSVNMAMIRQMSISSPFAQLQKDMERASKQLTQISEGRKRALAGLALANNNAWTTSISRTLQLARSSELSILSEATLSGFQWNNVGQILKIEKERRARINDRFLSFSRSYSNLMKSFEIKTDWMKSYHPAIYSAPAIGYYTSSDLLSSITVKEPKLELAEEEEIVRTEIITETRSTLAGHLTRVDPNLNQLWEGAKAALNSDHPDHVRHMSVSLRELLTHVLHKLAPDDGIREWSSDPEHYKNERPTREARLEFICRYVNHDNFRPFFKKDFAALLEFLDLFQRGTHAVTVSYSEKQLEALMIKTETTIRFMIGIWLLND